MSKCPYCGAPGGSAVSCGSCQHHKAGSSVRGAYTGGGSNNNGGGYSGGGQCFPGDAHVLTPAGQVRLDSLRVGQSVLSLGADGRVTTAVIKRVVSHPATARTRILKVVSEQAGLSFAVTSRHPVQAERGWVAAGDLRAGDRLVHIDASGSVVRHAVRGVEATDRGGPVYNLIVDGDHTYLVQGCVAHSFVYFRAIRVMANRIARRLIGVAPSRATIATA